MTDVYEVLTEGGDQITIDESDIAHGIDKSFKFQRADNSKTSQWLDPEDEHLMVWFQMESFSNF